jgi:hypothetical protein
VSFSNDEDGDGLAALFGGITPQGAPGEQPGRRQADATPAAGEPAPAAPEPTPAAPYVAPAAPPPQYPGLAEQPPTPGAYPPPAAAPATPAYEMPAPAAAPAPQAPQAYDLPAPAAPAGGAPYAPPASPQYPGLAPTPPYPATPEPTPYQPPVAAPSPAYPPTAQYPAGVDPASYAAPAGPVYGAPVAEPPASAPPASAPPASAPPASAPPASAPPAYEPPSYAAPPPTYAPPTYEAPPAYAPPTYEPPTYEPPTSATPPVAEQPTDAAPPPVVEPPAFSGFEALGLASTSTGGPEPFAAAEPPAERSFIEQAGAEEQPTETSYGDHPVVRAEAAPLASVFPPGPLLPAPAEGRGDESEDLARSTVLEKVGLGLAVLAGPLGLLLAIVTAIRGVRRRGWVIGIGRASLVFGVLSTIVFAIGGYALWNMRLDQLQHDQVAAASAEFCAAGDADRSLVTPPTLGWPRPGETITDSLALMQAWTDNWRALAATSPAELRDGMNLLAERGGVIIDAVTGSRSIDDAANQQQISSIEAQSGVSSWYVTYCVEP